MGSERGYDRSGDNEVDFDDEFEAGTSDEIAEYRFIDSVLEPVFKWIATTSSETLMSENTLV